MKVLLTSRSYLMASVPQATDTFEVNLLFEQEIDMPSSPVGLAWVRLNGHTFRVNDAGWDNERQRFEVEVDDIPVDQHHLECNEPEKDILPLKEEAIKWAACYGFALASQHQEWNPIPF